MHIIQDAMREHRCPPQIEVGDVAQLVRVVPANLWYVQLSGFMPEIIHFPYLVLHFDIHPRNCRQIEQAVLENGRRLRVVVKSEAPPSINGDYASSVQTLVDGYGRHVSWKWSKHGKNPETMELFHKGVADALVVQWPRMLP